MNRNVQRVVTALAEDILKVMRYVLDENGLGYSNLRHDLEVETSEVNDNPVVKLYANHYIYWVDQGRNPTNVPPIDIWPTPVKDITEWCKRKGIPSDNKTVMAIITKIHQEGYEGKFFMEDFWRMAEHSAEERLDELFEAIIEDLTEWFG